MKPSTVRLKKLEQEVDKLVSLLFPSCPTNKQRKIKPKFRPSYPAVVPVRYGEFLYRNLHVLVTEIVKAMADTTNNNK